MTAKPPGSPTSKMDILNARKDDEQSKSLGANDANELVTMFAAEGWLTIDRTGGNVSLGPRALLELRSYIDGEYGDTLVECTVCTEVVFNGETCTNDKCDIKMHHHCARQWFQGKARKCPQCSLPWIAAPMGWEDNTPAPVPRQFHPNAVAIDD